jgi:hypothetical protein
MVVAAALLAVTPVNQRVPTGRCATKSDTKPCFSLSVGLTAD